MTIPYCYFSCMYSLLFVDSSVKLVCMHASSHIITFSYMMCMPHSSICDSIVIIIDVHPTHISLTHGFQGNKHVMDVIIMTHAYSICRMPSLPSQINEACDEQLLLATKYCYGRKENMQLR